MREKFLGHALHSKHHCIAFREHVDGKYKFQQSHPSVKSILRVYAKPSQNSSRQRAVIVHDFHDTLMPYEQAWRWQQDLVSDMLSEKDDISGHLIILQHPPVFTLGAGSDENYLNFDPQNPPFPLFRTERGGEVTFHGPGQLVIYPILNLRHFTPDLHLYMRNLEEVVIEALAEVSGIQGGRIEGQTGVWVDERKVAAIGIRARRWITYHGLALNVTTDLMPYEYIVPCGIADKPVTNVKDILNRDLSPPSENPSQKNSETEMISQYKNALISGFENVFGVELLPGRPSPFELKSLQ